MSSCRADVKPGYWTHIEEIEESRRVAAQEAAKERDRRAQEAAIYWAMGEPERTRKAALNAAKDRKKAFLGKIWIGSFVAPLIFFLITNIVTSRFSLDTILILILFMVPYLSQFLTTIAILFMLYFFVKFPGKALADTTGLIFALGFLLYIAASIVYYFKLKREIRQLEREL